LQLSTSEAFSGTVETVQRTRDQIRDAAVTAYREAWSHRQDLGEIPVSRWAAYLIPNDYPAGIRGTLRDAVSYLFADLLSSWSLWSLREDNDVNRLDLPALIRGDVKTSAHPLETMAAVLADLEKWHQAAAATGHREAALEARWERLRRLHNAFSNESDREIIRRDLEESLATARGLPWWSMGMATLAEFLMRSESPDHLVRAHAGDQAEIKIVISNATGQPMRGNLVLDLLDPETETSLLSDFGLQPGAARLPFTAEPHRETSVTIPLTAPTARDRSRSK
jgi:hypothetical protein